MRSEPPNFDVPCGLGLRTELSLRALEFAKTQRLLHERTDGEVPGVLFGVDDEGKHGNFHPLAYEQIRRTPEWSKRLCKVHTAFKRSRARANWEWKELDCAHSSDALLMSIFCHPEVLTSVRVRTLLGIGPEGVPTFGFKPRTPLGNGKYDHTEVDMRLGELLVEAKLTESNFQTAKSDLVFRYRDLETVFLPTELSSRNGMYLHYQLIRGVLAAYAGSCSFCVLCDARRRDLMEAWYDVIRAVRLFELRCCLKLLTWQELTAELPMGLQKFLETKYGIFSSDCSSRFCEGF